MKILIIGTYMPRKCGIATFTHDLFQSIEDISNEVEIIAISDGSESTFPPEVVNTINRNDKSDYLKAADWINKQNYDCCILQHEFGIFGGDAGNFILDLVLRMNVPLITNLHTILQEPSKDELDVIQKLSALSDKITVMTQRGIEMLKNEYRIDSDKLELIPHGVPNFKISRENAKARLGLEGKKVMLSFGLLGRSKGYEVAIKACSKIRNDEFVYIIVGATHPNVLKEEGDSYKNSLIHAAAELKLSGKVFFVDHFVSDELLQIYLKACDIYVTPYPNVNQMSSGTLSFALGAGAAVLSTPYWYAKDLLANDRGRLFDFNDSEGLANIINELLENPAIMRKYMNNAEFFGKSMSWQNVGKSHLKLISKIIQPKNKIQEFKSLNMNIKFLNPGKSNNLISS